MSEVEELITKAKLKDLKAMGELFNQFKPLLKSKSNKYSKCGQKYEDVFQQDALLFILAIYDYKERPPVTFAGFIKKRIIWGLYHYNRRYRKRKLEVANGLDPISGLR